jgi:mono/diheme cytochrome c family protein
MKNLTWFQWRATVALVAAVVTVDAMIAVGPAAVRAADVKEGRRLYLRYCASCHGAAADGRGPVAPTLKVAPTDLTRLSSRYGSPLPAGQIARFIDGRSAVAAHGDREMPVWGLRFHDIYSAKGSAAGDMDRRIRAIIDYLDSVQRPALPGDRPAPPHGRVGPMPPEPGG